jgi:hypothetical protein
MLLNYNEKRAFPRMNVDCPAKIRLHGDNSARGAIVKNLSGGGVLIWLDQQMQQGHIFDITVEPGTDLTPPLDARVKVTRCTRLAEGEGSFAIACQIEQVMA